MSETKPTIFWPSIVLLFIALILSSIQLYISLWLRYCYSGVFDLLAIIVWIGALFIIPLKYKTKIATALISFGIASILLSSVMMITTIKFHIELGWSQLVAADSMCWVIQLCFFILLIVLGQKIKPDIWKKQYIVSLFAIISGMCIILLGIYLYVNLYFEMNFAILITLLIFGILDILFGYLIGPNIMKEPNKLLFMLLVIITTILVWGSLISNWQRGFI